MNIIEKITPLKPFVIVRPGKIGIETYINPELFRVNMAYKKQVADFLEGVVKQCRNTK